MNRWVFRFCARQGNSVKSSSCIVEKLPKTFAICRRRSDFSFKSCLTSVPEKFDNLKTRFILNLCPKDCVCIGNRSCLLPTVWSKDMQDFVRDDANGDVVKVFYSEEDKNVEIVMQLHGSTRTIQRSKEENLQKSLDRIKTNVKNANAKLLRKKKKKFMKDNHVDALLGIGEDSPTITLRDILGEKIDEDLKITEAWEKAKTLRICDLSYRVMVNPPKVESIKLVNMPIVGIPIYPQLQFKMATLDESRFQWFRRLCPETDEDNIEMDVDDKAGFQPGKHKMDSSDCESIDADTFKNEGWESVGEDISYTASEEDVGYLIQLRVYPGSKRYPHDSKSEFHPKPVVATTAGTVIKGPDKLLCAERIKQTICKCGKNSFRFVCYNILADVYASSDYAHSFLFPYCPTEAMNIDYRQQLILKELIGYNSDVICLQEVDRFVFESYFMPAMSLQGYAGAFAAKEGMKEGVSLFYRREKFRLVTIDNVILRKAFTDERNKDLYEKVSENGEFLKNFMSKPTCLLVGVLQSLEDSSKNILLGNTHFYWHPNGCHVRLIQVELVLREIRRLHAKYSANDPSSTFSCILTGDFNSNPFSGAVKLLTDGEVPANHADWYSMGKSEYLSNMALKNPTKYRSACGYPPYSNFVTRFQNLLDYIFIDGSLQVKKVVPHPDHELIVSHTALPNAIAPSDHLAQVADLSWKT